MDGLPRRVPIWQRTPRQERLALSHQEISGATGLTDRPWPNSDGLRLHWHCRPAPVSQGYEPGTVAVSLFFTNQRPKAATLVQRDQHSAFQAEGAQQQRLDPRDGGAL